MGYIIGALFIVVLVPLLLMMLSRRTKSGGGIQSDNPGFTRTKPSSDQPTPRPGRAVDPRIPPG